MEHFAQFLKEKSQMTKEEKKTQIMQKIYARGLGSELIAPCILNLQDIISLSTTSGFLLD